MANSEQNDIMAACIEFINPNEKAWELLNDIGPSQLFRKYNQQSELYEYKCLFSVENTQPTDFLDFVTDVDYMPKWNSQLKSIRKLDDGKYFYWETIFPAPFQNRDYVFSITRETIEYKQHTIQVMELRAHNGFVPEIEGVVRVTDWWQLSCTTIDDKCPTTTKVMSLAYMDLKMALPKWLTNFFAKVAFPKQHERILEQFKIYQLKQSKAKKHTQKKKQTSNAS